MMPQNSGLRTSNIYFFLAFVLVLAAGAYGFLQYQLFVGEKQAIADNINRIKLIASLAEKTEANVKKLRDAQADQQENFRKNIASILPPDENYTEFTRQLDEYFARNDKKGNEIFQSSLRFGKGTSVDGVTGVSMLPISMNIESTRDNFLKFLEYVNSSGSFETGTRLMGINSIQLNFPEGGEVLKDLSQKINFTVDMAAYYQTPKVAR